MQKDATSGSYASEGSQTRRRPTGSHHCLSDTRIREGNLRFGSRRLPRWRSPGMPGASIHHSREPVRPPVAGASDGSPRQSAFASLRVLCAPLSLCGNQPRGGASRRGVEVPRRTAGHAEQRRQNPPVSRFAAAGSRKWARNSNPVSGIHTIVVLVVFSGNCNPSDGNLTRRAEHTEEDGCRCR